MSHTFLVSSSYGNFLMYCFFWDILCRRRNKHFYVHFRRIIPVHFASKDEKYTSYKEGNEWKGVYFPLELAFQLCNDILKVLLPILYIDLACKQFHVSRQGKGKNRRNESINV